MHLLRNLYEVIKFLWFPVFLFTKVRRTSGFKFNRPSIAKMVRTQCLWIFSVLWCCRFCLLLSIFSMVFSLCNLLWNSNMWDRVCSIKQKEALLSKVWKRNYENILMYDVEPGPIAIHLGEAGFSIYLVIAPINQKLSTLNWSETLGDQWGKRQNIKQI